MIGVLIWIAMLLYLVVPLAIGDLLYRACHRWAPRLRGGLAILVPTVVWLVPAALMFARGGEGSILMFGVFLLLLVPALLISLGMLIAGLIGCGLARRSARRRGEDPQG